MVSTAVSSLMFSPLGPLEPLRALTSISPLARPLSPMTTRSGMPNEVCVFELDAGAAFAVVDENINASGFEFISEFVACGGCIIRVFDWRDDDGVWGECGWPNDAVFVVAFVTFDGGGEYAADADAVAAHVDWNAVVLFVKNASVECVGVFCAEFEDVAEFDATGFFECAAVVFR